MDITFLLNSSLEAYSYIKNLYRDMLLPSLQSLASYPLRNFKFFHWPGSLEKHHDYKFGLLIHTREVIEECLKQEGLTEDEKKILLISAIWHDYGKIWQYELIDPKFLDDLKNLGTIGAAGVWRKSPYYDSHYHVYLSAREFHKESQKYNLSWGEEIEHCILAHHGKRDWKAIAEPQTKCARILHAADSKSARLDIERKKELNGIIERS